MCGVRITSFTLVGRVWLSGDWRPQWRDTRMACEKGKVCHCWTSLNGTPPYQMGGGKASRKRVFSKATSKEQCSNRNIRHYMSTTYKPWQEFMPTTYWRLEALMMGVSVLSLPPTSMCGHKTVRLIYSTTCHFHFNHQLWKAATKTVGKIDNPMSLCYIRVTSHSVVEKFIICTFHSNQ